MSKALIAAALAACLLCGCGDKPAATFSTLKKAAIERDADTVWEYLTPEAQRDLDARARAFAALLPPSAAAEPGRAVLAMFVETLGDNSIEYIRTIRTGEVNVTGDRALMSIQSLRYGPSDRTLIFRKVDGKWKWDSRDTLSWYLSRRQSIQSFGG